MKGPAPLTTNGVRIRHRGWQMPMALAPWIVSDGLRERIEPLLPKRQWRFRYPHTVTSGDKLSFAARQTM